MIPEDLKYDEKHMWARVAGEEVTLGVSDYAQDQMGDIIYLELPDVGGRLTAGESFGSVESAKAIEELVAPFDGEVAAVNDALPDAPETMNSDPYGEGWLIKAKPDNPADLDNMLSPSEYEEFLGTLEQ